MFQLDLEFGITNSVDLIPNGSNITVTKENRLQYIHLVSHYRLNKQIRKQSDVFFEGLSEMIDHKWLRSVKTFVAENLLTKLATFTGCSINKKCKFL